eukprot:92725-Hanusia_phi.AAC.2
MLQFDAYGRSTRLSFTIGELEENVNLDSLLSWKMNAKKKYEVVRSVHWFPALLLTDRCIAMPQVGKRQEQGLARQLQVVDVGSGQSHLSRVLAWKYGYNVRTLESNSCNVETAKHIDRHFQYERSKKECHDDVEIQETGVKRGELEHLK